MSDMYNDPIGNSFNDPWSQRLPGDPKPQQRSRVEIEDRSGMRLTEIIPGPPPMPGSDWISSSGGTVINSRRVD
ncbi:hypothetical protein [Acaryochloris marina]|uniref:Uncharacterized protein n=1 Tax=Acaryochloris marina (strain MBIC 11017) TaxID=329726 RepID=A8ZL37_ACAM1|nr:hypothetical protein [Acaryochloris marina]ABW31504.1 hypothetical protein AM1_A0386 [Acaryochloris marina MBIC11017]